MKIVKFLGITVAIILALVLITVLVINTIPGDQYKRMIGAAVKSATGRDLVIGGDLEIGLGKSFRVLASDVSFENVPWGSRLQMFSGGLIEGEVRLMPLLDGMLDVRLVVEAPDLLLETDVEGRGNWQMAAGTEEEPANEGRGSLLRPYIRELRLEQVKVAYLDAVADQQHHAEFDTILLSSQGEQVVVELNGRINGHVLDLHGGVDHVANGDTDSPAVFTLTGKVGEVRLNANGTLDALSTMANADLLLEVKVPSLAALSAFVGSELPDQGPLDASLRINGGEGAYRADDIDVKLGAEMLAAAVAGTIADLAALNGIDLNVTMNTSRLAEVVAQLGVEVPAGLPPVLAVEAKILGRLDALAVPTYRVEVQDDRVEASVAGQVRNLSVLKGLKADLSVEATSLAALSRYTDASLPDSGPVSLSGKLSSPDGLDAKSDISAIIKADGVMASLSGRVADLRAAQGIAMAVEVEGDSLQQVARLAGQDLDGSEPVQLKGDLSLDSGIYKADKLLFKSGDNEFSGTLEFTRPAQDGGRAKLLGNLHLGTLDLDALLGRAAPAPTASTGALQPDAGLTNQTEQPAGIEQVADTKEDAVAVGAAGDTAAKVFPSDPLPVKVLRKLDADMEITADEIATRELQLQGVVVKLALHNGILRMEPVNATVGSGAFQASLVLTASRSPAMLAVVIDMDDGTSRRFGGRYDLQVDVEGTGDSIAQLMASLDGQVIIDVRDMDLDKTEIPKIGYDVLETFNPFDKKQVKPRLVCAVMRADIKDGIVDAEEKFVAKFAKVTWFGGGTINLQTESIDFGAQSKPRTGLGLDAQAGLAGLVHIGGTLATPTIVPDPEGVANKYGETLLSVATGGLYLLAKGQRNKTWANSDVCAEILAMEDKERERNSGDISGAETDAVAPRTDPAEAGPIPDAETGRKTLLDLLDRRDR